MFDCPPLEPHGMRFRRLEMTSPAAAMGLRLPVLADEDGRPAGVGTERDSRVAATPTPRPPGRSRPNIDLLFY
jgi:hypothetical protein